MKTVGGVIMVKLIEDIEYREGQCEALVFFRFPGRMQVVYLIALFVIGTRWYVVKVLDIFTIPLELQIGFLTFISESCQPGTTGGTANGHVWIAEGGAIKCGLIVGNSYIGEKASLPVAST